MNGDVATLHGLHRRLHEAIEATGDYEIRLAWMRIETSEAWIATSGTGEFCELTMREVIVTLAIPGWDSPRRVRRILGFGQWAGFLPIGESR